MMTSIKQAIYYHQHHLKKERGQDFDVAGIVLSHQLLYIMKRQSFQQNIFKIQGVKKPGKLVLYSISPPKYSKTIPKMISQFNSKR